MAAPSSALEAFHPLIREWFKERFPAPTEAQTAAWPPIAAGGHVLVIAPTGSGKTLTAFLWALNQLFTGAWPAGRMRVLYISPLRALNNDIRRNLTGPLEELAARFAARGVAAPAIRAATRSSDTPAEERQRMQRHPPEILVTTPESLNLILTGTRSRELLTGVRTVILDEVHAVAGTRRGAHLISAVERVALAAGEFQRIALSATVDPPAAVAQWVGGQELIARGPEPVYRPRTVEVIAPRAVKPFELKVAFGAAGGADAAGGAAEPPDAAEVSPVDRFWIGLAAEIRAALDQCRSTLVFANSRRTVERVARLVNEGQPAPLVYAHHGSISRELRLNLEERLKAGELRGLVATNSLELGIDIGAVDQVLLIGTPPSLASAVQRIGRAGHQVGAVSRGRFLPLFPRDLIGCAVTARTVEEGRLEPIRPVQGPLDLLAQVLVSMTTGVTWDLDRLYAVIRCAAPYRDLPRRLFDLVVEMLAGRYAGTRIRELLPLVALDREEATIRARPGAESRIYLGGGTIPDRGLYHLRRADSRARIGELDEEFVWERRLGDVFSLGAQSWRIERITHNDVFVTPAGTGWSMPAFWRADERDRSWVFAQQIGGFLEQAERRRADPGLIDEFENHYHMDRETAGRLIDFLDRQRQATEAPLPHRRHLLAEWVIDPLARGEPRQLILHTFWGGRVNRPLAVALAALGRERTGVPFDLHLDDDAIAIAVPEQITARELLALVRPERLEELLADGLAETGYFGARFREAAGTALLLPKKKFGERQPLWVSRLRAQRLLEALRGKKDFPVLLETWRTCLVDGFELEALRERLAELERGEIELSEVVRTTPSPFAEGIAWKRTNDLVYRRDQPEQPPGAVRQDLLQELIARDDLRPAIEPRFVEELAAKLERTAPGYAPGSPLELLAWVEERVFLTADQWERLLAAGARDHDLHIETALAEIGPKLARVEPAGDGAPSWICARNRLPELQAVLTGSLVSPRFFALSGEPLPTPGAPRLGEEERAAEPGDRLAEWLAEALRFYSVIEVESFRLQLGIDRATWSEALAALVEGERIVIGRLTRNAEAEQLADAENVARLLRMQRAARRPKLEPLPIAQLGLFLAARQGLAGGPAPDLPVVLEQLAGFPAPVELWENALLPARIPDFDPSQLDATLAHGDFLWLGCGERKVTFAGPGDRELLGAPHRPTGGDPGALFPTPLGRFAFEDLLAHSRLPSMELAERLWKAAWGGRVTTDTFAPVRRALAQGFQVEPVEAPPAVAAGHRRLRFREWQRTRPFAGHFALLPVVERDQDPLEQEELRREQVRLVLGRYGILFKELLERELPAFRFGALFRTLRLMELSGEILSGQFFDGIPGLQFLAPDALPLLGNLPAEAGYWLSASDPASLAGLPFAGLPAALPRRLPGNLLAFHGEAPVVVVERSGRKLTITLAPADPDLPEALHVLMAAFERSGSARPLVTIETINGVPAAESGYRTPLSALFETVKEMDRLVLIRKS